MSVPQIPDPSDNVKEFLGIDDGVMGLVFDAALGEVPGVGSFVGMIGSLNSIIGAFNTISELLTGTRRPLVYSGTSANDTLNTDDSNVTIYDVLGNQLLLIDALVGRPFVLQGYGGDDVLTVHSASGGLFGWGDILVGGSGVDTMSGGSGSDTYHVDDSSDVINESAFGGTDTVILSGSSYSLPAEVENGIIDRNVSASLTGNVWDNRLIGNNGNDRLNGHDGNDKLAGGDGNDILNGGTGTDTMTGGTGNDDYHLSDKSDRVLENEHEGFDRIFTAFTYSLKIAQDNYNFANTIEGLILSGTGDFDATGNDLHNDLQGNTGHNTLNGLLGNDSIQGHAGNDRLLGDEGNDDLDGGAGNDFLRGGAGNDTLKSGGGTVTFNVLQSDGSYRHVGGDTLIGGAGDDTYYVADGTLSVSEAGDSTTDAGGYDRIYTSSAWNLPSNGQIFEELIFEGTANINGRAGSGNNKITGNSGNNELVANEGQDTLIGGLGNDKLVGDGNDSLAGDGGNDTLVGYAFDVLAGGLGDDFYVLKTGNVVVTELAGQGYDTLLAFAANVTLSADQEIEFINLKGDEEAETGANSATQKNLRATGNNFSQQIYGDKGQNVIAGLGGDDRLWGDDGLDTLEGGAGNDTLIGSYAGDAIQGGSLVGGAGDDLYMVYSASDVLTELANEGTDHVESAISFTLPAHVESMSLFYSAERDTRTATGNALNNVIGGSRGSDVIDGMAGADTMRGLVGDDTYIVDNVGDVVVETDFFAPGVFANGTRTSGNFGFTSGGRDTVKSSVTYTLSANIETLELTGTGNINGTGNAQANRIIGNSGNNILHGGSDNWEAVDTLEGGVGDDIYEIYLQELTRDGETFVQSDKIIEYLFDGFDILRIRGASFNARYRMPSNIERIEVLDPYGINLWATNGDDSVKGGSGSDTLAGWQGNDTLDGAGNADVLIGEWGSDTYIVDQANDYVVEIWGPGGGEDLVMAKVSYSLQAPTNPNAAPEDVEAQDEHAALYPRGVEHLTLLDSVDGGSGTVGTGNRLVNRLTGNALNNELYGHEGDDTLIGNAGNDTLDGGLGGDSMEGGIGDDTYVVDRATDVVVEGAGAGTDTIRASINFSLETYANIENLTLIGDAINATGNALNNVITGNGGNNRLDGGAGADTMNGGGGDDTFVVDNVGDVVSGSGKIESSISYILGPSSPSELRLTGTANLNGTGNSFSNTLRGNAGNNVLDGGGGQFDDMWGGEGDDTYYFRDEQNHAVELGGGGTDEIFTPFTINLAEWLPDPNDANGVIGNTRFVTLISGEVKPVDYGLGIENVTLTGSSAIDATGNRLGNRIKGTTNDNVLDGGGGRDTLIGGQGDDTYITDGIDVIDEVLDPALPGVIDLVNGAGGHDDVKLTLENGRNLFVLSNGIEDLLVVRARVFNEVSGNWDLMNLTLYGNALDNVISLNGEGLNDRIDGGAGADTMSGGRGDDLYFVDNTGDRVLEYREFVQDPMTGEQVDRGGHDKVMASASFSLAGSFNADWIEELQLTGSNNINGTGNSQGNRIVGNSGNNILNGGTGDDTLIGAGGADIFVVDSTNFSPGFGDVVQEGLDAEIDLVQSYTTDWTLGSSGVENLTFMTGGTNTGVGNAQHNVITGNSGKDTLSGAAGNDTLIGGGGDDSLNGGTDNDNLQGDGGDDVLVGADGNDTLTGGDNNDTLSGGLGADNLQGGAGLDVLLGHEGNDTLDGGTGGDTLRGGADNDLYRVDDSSDRVFEELNEGSDTVESSAELFTLQDNIENLTLVGEAFRGFGNAQNNLITGNGGGNILGGGGGIDTVNGGGGDDVINYDAEDTLNGEAGIDTLRVEGSGVALDLNGLAGSKLTGFEQINLTGTGGNLLKLDAAQLKALSTESDTLRVLGNAGDAVSLVGTWSHEGQVGSGTTFERYLSDGAELLVETGVAVVVPVAEFSVADLDGSNGFRLWSDPALNAPQGGGGEGGEDSGAGEPDFFGEAVAFVGDLNGDGFADLMIGAPYTDLLTSYGYTSSTEFVDGVWVRPDFSSLDQEVSDNAGAAYVVLGGAEGFAASTEVHTLTLGDGFTIKGDGVKATYDVYDYGDGPYARWDVRADPGVAGRSVSSAGDVNGDGFVDLIIGAPRAGYNYLSTPGGYINGRQGASYVVFGTGGEPSTSVGGNELDGTNGFTLMPEGIGILSGFDVAGIGDFNGDGIDDLVVGAYYAGMNRQGAVFVVFGAESGIDAKVDIAALNGSDGFMFTANAETVARLGDQVAAAGDVNGDGYDDLVVASRYGSAHVVLGTASGLGASLDATDLDDSTGFSFYNGGAVAGAGDFNGDGFADLVFGGGGAALVFGSADNAGLKFIRDAVEVTPYGNWEMGTYALSTEYGGDGTHGFFMQPEVVTIVSEGGEDGGSYSNTYDGATGASVGSAGDVNGDGFDDLIIGAPETIVDGMEYAGAVYIVFGTSAGISEDLDLAALDGLNGFKVYGDTANSYFGFSVAGAGDLNGDGFDDMIVGALGGEAYNYDTYSYENVPGQVYVIYGKNFNGAAGTIGTAGNDTLTASGTGAVVRGGSGDDVIRISASDFFRIDGGGGSDTLELTGSGQVLDFSTLQGNALRNIEAIDLTGTGANAMEIGMLQAIDLVDSGRVLKVHGNAGDQLTLLDSPIRIVGVSYDTYQYANFSIQVDKAISVTLDA